ncbi:MAG: tetratricopeptide repeat protein [Schumannella sp.]|nr:tetratricopeptide repeat protein [Microbacteriaceae bacterium]
MAQPPPEPVANLRGAVDLSALVQRANAPAPSAGDPAGGGAGSGGPGSGAPGAGPGVAGLVVATSDATFDSVMQLSTRVPVVVEFYAPGLEPALGAIVESYDGRLVLATVDAQVNPQLAQAFQVREVPAVAAIIAGRPVNLFLGIPQDAEVRQVLDELLALAAQNGVSGRIDVSGAGGADAEGAEGAGDADASGDANAPGDDQAPAEPPLPPHHQEAFDAISAGDFATAIAEYRAALVENPRDSLATAGLAQVSLLQRLDGADAGAIRSAAAESPGEVAAQLAVADLDVSGGHLEDAFGRLLDLFASLDPDDRDAVRTRLLEYFEIAGGDDPRVHEARRRLTGLLY